MWGWSALLLAATATLVGEGYALLWLAFGVSTDHPVAEMSRRSLMRPSGQRYRLPWDATGVADWRPAGW